MKFKLYIKLSVFLLIGINAFGQKKQIDTLYKKIDSPVTIHNRTIDILYGLGFPNSPTESNHRFTLYQDTLISSLYYKVIHFDKFLFNESFYATETIFKNPIIFDNAKFSFPVSFGKCIFKGYTSFVKTHFKKYKVEIEASDFQDKCFFDHAIFDQCFYMYFGQSRLTSFKETKFKNGLDFTNQKFLGISDFSYATFSGEAVFKSTLFNAPFYLSHATINGNFNFYNASLKNAIDLSAIKTSDTTQFSFRYAHLPNLINISENPNLNTTVDFTHANLDSSILYTSARSWHYINLVNTNLSKVKIDYQHFRLCFYSNVPAGKGFPFSFVLSASQPDKSPTLRDDDIILCHKTKFALGNENALIQTLLKNTDMQAYLKQIFPSAELSDPIITSFLLYCIDQRSFPRPLSTDEIQSGYEKLLKTFKDNCQNDSYEALDIEYRDYKNGSFILPHIWNCYGYRREWVFYWALAFLAFFTIITTFFIGTLNKPTADGGVYHMDNLNIDPATERWYNRLWYAFMYTSTLFFILKVDVSKLNFKKKAGVFYIITIYSVGLLCLAYMANFVLQK